MRTVCLLFVALTFGSAQDQKNPPDLNTTLAFMHNTLSRYGYIHTSGVDQELNLKGDEPCRVYVEWEITVKTHSPQDGAYPDEYQFHLGTIDPESVKVVTPQNQKQPEGWKRTNVHLATTNNQSTIWASASDWKESKKVPKSLQLWEMTDFDFQFRDKEQAERFAKALKHAITLCGGKSSAF